MYSADFFTKKADPYLVVTVDDAVEKTACRKKTLEPVWGEAFCFNCVAGRYDSVFLHAVFSAYCRSLFCDSL